MTQPLFSVVIPAYNEEKTIAACLKSIISQNFPQKNYEVIVVNNNSTDKTKEIAKEFPVRVINEPKRGYVWAIARGAREAKGEIIVYTDADTKVGKNWLRQYAQAFTNPKVLIAGGGAIFKPKFLLIKIIEPFINLTGRIFKIYNGFNFAVRKKTYNQVGGFNPKMNSHVDTDLFLRIKKVGKSVYLPQNKVITSSRHYQGIKGILYPLKGVLNVFCLILFGKTIFYEFGDVR